MTTTATQSHSKSLKTFFLYAGIVLFFIFVSLAIKIFFVVKASKFDSKHQFIVSIAQKNKVKEIVSFDPQQHEVTVFQLQGNDLSQSSFGKTLAIIPDARVNTSSDLPLDATIGDVTKTLLFKYSSIKTDMTIFDVARLMLLSQKISTTNQTQKDIVISKDMESNGKLVGNFFTDEAIFSDNVPIQIINASGTPGMGKRLEVALSHLGCNIVAVSTARKNEQQSKIEYFGGETYTQKKLTKLLSLTAEKTEKQSLATIVITIGVDKNSTEDF